MGEIAVSERLVHNYRDYYADGDSEWRRLGALGKAENIVALCRDLPRRAILEIGAGEGALLRRLAELRFAESFHATEISRSGVAATLQKQIPGLVECRLFDGYSLPYPDARFDLAILSHVLEHVEHPRKLLAEASRVARFVFVEVPLEDTLRLPADFVFDAVGHINVYSPKTIRHLVQSCGLEVLRQITTNPSRAVYRYRAGSTGWLRHWIKQLLVDAWPGVATRLFTYHASLLCTATGGDPKKDASAQPDRRHDAA